jgi:predicted TIM-barrel fold metal-dependent hydrolase
VPETNGGHGRIDVQFHFSPAFYTERVQQASHITTDRWSVEAALHYMDTHRVAAGVMSVSTPSVNFLPPGESVAMARRLNDAAAQVARENPGRFGNFATLPMADVAATLTEIDYCLDELGMEGVCMMSNIAGDYLGHERFAPIFDELNRRKAVVFVHPTDPAYQQVRMAPVAEWPFDTARAAIDLMYSGTIARCPDVTIILAHAGGALPMVARRVEEMSVVYAAASAPTTMEQTIEQVANFYYDLAISAHDNAMGALRGVTGVEHVLFACDWPFAPDVAVQRNIAGFESLDLTPDERYAIERGNAARLFPTLTTNRSSAPQ